MEPIRYFDDAGAAPLRNPAALVAFGGWVDAGTGGTGAIRYLVNSTGARKVADIESEDFYSFTDTRPLVSVVGPSQRAIHWPRGEMYAAPLAATSPRDLVLFVAPEPNLRWQTFCTVLLDGLQRQGVTQLICLGSIFSPQHHRADIPLNGWSPDPRLREVLAQHAMVFSKYEGPTGITTALLLEAHARGIPAASVFGFSPNYIQGVPNPRVSHTLLKNAAAILGVELHLGELERAGRTLMRQVDQLLENQPELREQVERMLEVAKEEDEEEDDEEPTSADAPPPGPPTELPSPQAVVQELEDFLKQLRQDEGGSTGESRPDK